VCVLLSTAWMDFGRMDSNVPFCYINSITRIVGLVNAGLLRGGGSDQSSNTAKS